MNCDECDYYQTKECIHCTICLGYSKYPLTTAPVTEVADIEVPDNPEITT